MSGPQFTPGPWWTELDKVFVGTPPDYSLIADADPDCKGGHDGAEPMLANARLIAAAPELYEALSDIMENPLYQTAIGGNPNMVERLMERASAALAKARGEQVPA